MAKLTTAKRKDLPTSEFALPKQRKFPVDSKARAANAKARAMQMFKVGKITMDQLDEIVRKANTKLKATNTKTIQTASQMLNKR